MMTAAVKEKTVEEARALSAAFAQMMELHGSALEGNAPSQASDEAQLGDLEALQGVVKFPVRVKCATLSWHTLSEALDELDTSE